MGGIDGAALGDVDVAGVGELGVGREVGPGDPERPGPGPVQALPPHLGAEIVDFTLDEGTIKLDGMADSFATVDRVKKALDLSGYFRDIQVTHATAGSDPSKVEFRLTAAVRGEMME